MLLSKVEKDDCKEMLSGFNNMKAKVKLVEEPVERKVMGEKWFLIKFIVKVALGTIFFEGGGQGRGE